MSISNDIRNLIDLQDENITFLPGCVERAEYKGQPCKFIHGDLFKFKAVEKHSSIRNQNKSRYKAA